MVPAGNFQQRLAHGIAIVLDQADMVSIDHGHKGHGAAVDDHLALGGGAVGQHHALQCQVDFQTSKNDALRWAAGRVGDTLSPFLGRWPVRAAWGCRGWSGRGRSPRGRSARRRSPEGRG